MTWNYRVIWHAYAVEPTYGIHEVYYDEKGKPNGYIIDKSPWSEDKSGLEHVLSTMAEAFRAPILRLDSPDGELVELEDEKI